MNKYRKQSLALIMPLDSGMSSHLPADSNAELCIWLVRDSSVSMVIINSVNIYKCTHKEVADCVVSIDRQAIWSYF
jgi:hypothetical protein